MNYLIRLKRSPLYWLLAAGLWFTTIHASVQVTLEDDAYTIDNGLIAVRVPAGLPDDYSIPPPVQEVLYDGNWYGEGAWQTDLVLEDLVVTPLDDGVRLLYDFKNNCKVSGDPYLDVTIRLRADAYEIMVEDEYVMSEASAYSFRVTKNFTPKAIKLRNYVYWTESATGVPNPSGNRTLDVLPRPRWANTLTPDILFYLVPRWSQGADAGYYSLSYNADSSVALGVAVCRAGTWKFPHDSYIWARTNPEGGELFYDFPTQRGGRFYLILAGDFDQYASGHSVLDSYQGYSGGPKFYDNNYANPTGGIIRNTGNTLLNNVKGGSLPACEPEKLFNWLHPDFWGYPHNLWSPINPNFYSDLIKVPALRACGCEGNPMYDSIRTILLDLLTKHIEISWAVPGGAGECPGYNLYGYHELEELEPLLKQYLDIDFQEIEAYREARVFIDEVGRTPQGDTHRPDRWKGTLTKTKEYPQFGIVFATDDEFLAWKAGPMRGHYHGDQLSFHWWDKAIDHQVSYNPRADQEHMHNRVAFSPDDWEYANMDGFERVIAFDTMPVADAGIAQVQSKRLRKMPEYPPAVWQAKYEEKALEEELTYRRTMVMVKGNPDYFVIRDQHWGPRLDAAYTLHTKGTKVEWNGVDLVDFGNMALYIAKPKTGIEYKRFDYNYSADPSKGVMLTLSGDTTEFVTVLWPNGDLPEFAATDAGVNVGTDQIVFADPSDNLQDPIVMVNGTVVLTSGDVDLNRSQGYGYLDQGRERWDASIFIPEVGYPMGPVPEWYLKQRVPGFSPENEHYAFGVAVKLYNNPIQGSDVVLEETGGQPPYRYEWNTGSSAASISQVPDGQYTVTVTDAQDCYRIIDITVDSTITGSALLEDQSEYYALSLYPVPASDQVFYTGIQEQQGEVRIYAASGNVVHQEKGELPASFSASKLNPGVYIVRIKSRKNRIYIGKFVKE